ncbi:Hsp70 family protein [Lentzea sp. DG1S-22]|uniref:Hsp70 family protein n=1 Tax=Lentzea sp. DG1S-22 TaxID=3108822 RepID=UPI002E75B4B8|nr:Hsp70 family protein [Lentzea sp. DG1S-22]WVH82403.1 Hsp70 family protein [Lentzea sp. DG1S-22]
MVTKPTIVKGVSIMDYGLGVDLGTTFTAAAVSGANGTRMVPLGPGVAAPSAVYVRPDGVLVAGTNAVRAGEQDPIRLVRGYKRRLGDPTPLVVGGVAHSPQALLSAQLRDIVAGVTAAEGAPPRDVVLTCPAVWGPYRREHFDEVPRLAGLGSVRIVTEPEAAAMHYSVERRLGDGELVAVYDLGGGTFDATILRARPGGMEILGTPEGIERLGGMDFDEALLAHVDSRLDGAVSALDPADPEHLSALVAVRGACVRAKEALSIEPDVTVRVPLPGGTLEVTVTRVEFNDMIRPSVELTTDALRRTIASAGLQPSDLAGVLLAGGSSRIPAVPQAVSAAFGKPVRVSLHPKFTVALGAAALARTPAKAVASSPPARTFASTSAKPAPQGLIARIGAPKWLVPVTAAAAAVALTATALVVFDTGDSPQASGGTPPSSASSPSAAPNRVARTMPDMEAFTGRDTGPYRAMLGSAEDGWAGTVVGEDGAAGYRAITTAPEGPGAVRITWSGSGPGQFYMQHTGGGSDLRPQAEADSALVVDVVVHEAPSDRVALAIHCVFPCAAELNSTGAFKGLKTGQQQTIKIPISCFTKSGLNAANVNTPFLVVTAGRFDATFGHVRWVAGAATDPDATPCDKLA